MPATTPFVINTISRPLISVALATTIFSPRISVSQSSARFYHIIRLSRSIRGWTIPTFDVSAFNDFTSFTQSFTHTILSTNFLDKLKHNYSRKTLFSLRRTRFDLTYLKKYHPTIYSRLFHYLPATSHTSRTVDKTLQALVKTYGRYKSIPITEFQQFSDFNPFYNPLVFILAILLITEDTQSGKPMNTALTMLTTIVSIISHCSQGVPVDRRDDFWRQSFSAFNNLYLFPRLYNVSTSQAAGVLYGLDVCGGPRGWTVEQVIADAKQWVDPPVLPTWGALDKVFVTNAVDRFSESWLSQNIQLQGLTFPEFVTDPFKWATSGGAPSVSIAGEDVRSKWMWALDNLTRTSDLYGLAKTYPNECKVALKEETKTRLVITTPMKSYLHQSYLWYIFGKPQYLQSTISKSKANTDIAMSNITNYVCIDAEAFDQNIPLWFITYIFESMLLALDRRYSTIGDRVIHTRYLEIRKIIQQEIQDIKTMTLVCYDKQFPYRNGLMSGWRFTSLIGSLASQVIAEYLNFRLGSNAKFLVQGDDIILMMDSLMARYSKHQIIAILEQFGMKVNKTKTTIGPIGEFLKQQYYPHKVTGLPLRQLRSIFYANPWISSYKHADPSSLCDSWWTFYSRFSTTAEAYIDHQTFTKFATDDIHRWAGKAKLSRRELVKLLSTPSAMGGLGYLETISQTTLERINSILSSKNQNKTVEIDYYNYQIQYAIPEEKYTHSQKFYSLFGYIPNPNRKTSMKILSCKLKLSKSNILTFMRHLTKADQHGFVAQDVGMVGSNRLLTLLSCAAFVTSSDPFRSIRDHLLGQDDYLNLYKTIPKRLKSEHHYLTVLSSLMYSPNITFPKSILADATYYRYASQMTATITRLTLTFIRNVTPSKIQAAASILAAIYLQTKTILHSM